jgi:hypothetical protein
MGGGLTVSGATGAENNGDLALQFGSPIGCGDTV